MERDFRYLRDKYGEAGARDIFEKICVELFQKKFENAYAVQASPGDDGIDVLVGDLDGDIIVYQCKYFIDGIGDRLFISIWVFVSSVLPSVGMFQLKVGGKGPFIRLELESIGLSEFAV